MCQNFWNWCRQDFNIRHTNPPDSHTRKKTQKSKRLKKIHKILQVLRNEQEDQYVNSILRLKHE